MADGPDFRTPFDDDGHTFRDGPFERFMRMRKWFFAVSIVLLLIDTDWWDYQAASRIAGLSFPISLAHATLTITATYLLIQASLVLFQLGLTYGPILQARVVLTDSAQLRTLNSEIAKLEQNIERETARVTLRKSGDDPKDSLNRVLTELMSRRETLVARQQQTQRVVMAIEFLLDAMRIFPTLIFLGYGLLAHGSLDFIEHGYIPSNFGR